MVTSIFGRRRSWRCGDIRPVDVDARRHLGIPTRQRTPASRATCSISSVWSRIGKWCQRTASRSHRHPRTNPRPPSRNRCLVPITRSALKIRPVVVDVPFDGGGIGDFSGDGEYLPIVKVAPIYPRRALMRNIEGFVLIELVVTATGTVRDPVVARGEAARLFRASGDHGGAEIQVQAEGRRRQGRGGLRRLEQDHLRDAGRVTSRGTT